MLGTAMVHHLLPDERVSQVTSAARWEVTLQPAPRKFFRVEFELVGWVGLPSCPICSKKRKNTQDINELTSIGLSG